jgi:hypothetical protein
MSEKILSLSEEEVWEIVSQMNALVQQDVDSARAMLIANPAAGLAVLKAQIRLDMVTGQSISTVLSQQAQRQAAVPQPPPPPTQQPLWPAPPPPQQQPQRPPQPPQPPQPSQSPPPQQLPPPPQLPPADITPAGPPAALPSTQDAEQQALLQQVMQLTPEMIAALPPEPRAQIEQLRQMYRS